MAGTNTEKPTGKAELKKQGAINNETASGRSSTQSLRIKKQGIVKTSKQEKPVEVKTPVKKEEGVIKEESQVNEKTTSEKKETKKPVSKKVVKEEVCVNAVNVPISTKDSIALCKFVKRKTIEQAVKDLEQVLMKKKAVPMKGEIPHKKGIMSGRYPKNSTEHFLVLVKSLGTNAVNHEVDNPVITEAVANFAHRPFGRGGKLKKRTHITLKAKDRTKIERRTARGRSSTQSLRIKAKDRTKITKIKKDSKLKK